MGVSPAVSACSLTIILRDKASPVVKEERYFAPNDDAQAGGPAEDQRSGDGGGVPMCKVPRDIVPRVGSSRWFPGE